MFDRLLFKIHARIDRHLLHLPPRAKTPFLTHLPILLAAEQWLTLGSVLEFGCGDNSTLAFLKLNIFKNLLHLRSYENDAIWAERIQRQVGPEARLDLRLVEGAVSSIVREIDLEQFDLILIDDSVTGEDRAKTIRAVADKHPRRAIVVVHDFEYYPYRVAARPFKHCFRFTGQNPNTGLLWNDANLNFSQLRNLNKVLQKIGEKESLDAWVSAFSSIDLSTNIVINR